MNNKKLSIYVNNLVEKYGLQLKSSATSKCLCEYVENIVFNIVSISAIISFINNCKSINSNTLEIVSSYIKENCGNITIKGGGGAIVMPSEFYGINSGRYNVLNNTTDVLNVDFNNGIARTQIGGGKEKSPFIPVVKDIINYYKLKASSVIINKIVKIIEGYLDCLMMKLKENKTGKLTSTYIKKVIKANKVFNVFK
jgi:hypothetical protein